MDVTAEVVSDAKGARHLDELLHGVVRRLNDSGGEKESFDVVALIEIEGEVANDLFGRKRARRMSEEERLTQKTQS